MPEVIAHEQTGFLCNNLEECVQAVGKVAEIDRNACRTYVENRFNVQSMTDGYEAAYHQVLASRFVQNRHLHELKLPAPAMSLPSL